MLFSMSLITIITINFNNAKGLKKTIDSVVSQTFQDFEYIVIDGCSKDESVDLIKQSPRIDYWVSEKDQGIYDAMNKGIKQAKGSYCLFLNSGDYLFSKSSLETMHHSLLLGIDIVYGNMKIEKEDHSLTDGFMPVKIDRNHMLRDTLWHPVSFIRRELFQVCGLYDTNYRIVADYKWFLHAIFRQKVSLQHVDSFVSVFEMGGVSNSVDTIGKLRAERRSAQIEVFGKSFVTLYYLKLKWTGYLKRLINKFGFK
jgi:glycosyltransferase involved in cell wall biosynthesis